MAKTVVIQRGHCYRKSGATGAPGEQEFATKTASHLKPLLEAAGFHVRVINADVPDSDYRGDAFVAIHYDSAGNNAASGASVGYQGAAGDKLARLWRKYYFAEGWDRGFRPDNYTTALARYYGVGKALQAGNHAAIITESGFHTNPGDKALMTPERTARSIVRAVAAYFGKTLPDKVGETDDMPGFKDRFDLSDEQQKVIPGPLKDMSLEGALGYAPAGYFTAKAVEKDLEHVHTNLHTINDKMNAMVKQIEWLVEQVKESQAARDS